MLGKMAEMMEKLQKSGWYFDFPFK